MSIRLNEKVTCPKCGFMYEHECCPSVNATTDPSLREQVVSGSLCVTTCPNCSVVTRLVYPCLYQDPERGFSVYFLPRTEARSIPAAGEMESLMEGIAVKTRRLVDDYTELMEKIAIFELGLDDRVMELFKAYTAISMMSVPNAAFKPDTLVFQGRGDDDHFVILGIREKDMRQMKVPAKLYTALDAMVGSRDWGDGDDFVMVDMIWALDLLKREGSILDRGASPAGGAQ
ncbi:MAG: CpXC domain-containing protein [Christensenellales bacterium]